MNDMILALQLAGIGLATVFGVLLLFYGIIALLGKVFPNKSK